MTSEHAHNCKSCNRPCNSYDADRGYSCHLPDCPRVIADNVKQHRYGESRRLREGLLPALLDLPITGFTVREVLAITDKYGDGFVLEAAAQRLGIPTPSQKGPTDA